MTRISDARPLAALWHCERHEGGWLIIAEAERKQYAYHLQADAMKTAHDPEFMFWQGVGAISRAVARVQEVLND